MKLIILHGDYVIKSYERLSKFILEAKKRGWEISDYDNETVYNQSLFGKERFVVSRDYKKLNKKNITKLDKYPGTFVIYNEGNIPQTFIKTLTDPKIEEYKLPKVIWNFLDNISVKLFHEVIKTEPVEFVFPVLAKRFRDLYWVKAEPRAMNYAPWQIAKLKKQSEKFTTSRVIQIINEMAEIDIKVKTSKANLISSLDFLLLRRLE